MPRWPQKQPLKPNVKRKTAKTRISKRLSGAGSKREARIEFECMAFLNALPEPKRHRRYDNIGEPLAEKAYKARQTGDWPAGINYGGDPALGLNDNSFPEIYPYNTSDKAPLRSSTGINQWQL